MRRAVEDTVGLKAGRDSRWSASRVFDRLSSIIMMHLRHEAVRDGCGCERRASSPDPPKAASCTAPTRDPSCSVTAGRGAATCSVALWSVLKWFDIDISTVYHVQTLNTSKFDGNISSTAEQRAVREVIRYKY